MVGVDIDVALVPWPSGEGKRHELAELHRPRLLLVDHDAEPPVCNDHLEDWVRLPASSADTKARVNALKRRVGELTPLVPVLEDDGALRYLSSHIDLPALQARLLEPLIERFGAVVSRDVMMRSGWPGESPASNTLDVHLVRLRRRLAPHGLEIRTVRSRGYLLTASDRSRS